MATSDPYIGRRLGLGLGIEGTPGTAVAPQVTMRWLDNSIQSKADIIENDSAMGVVDRVNDSAIVSKYVEGKIGGKVTSKSVGYLLLGMFGTVSTGTQTGGIYPHTFSVKQSSIPTTLTLTEMGPLASARYAYATVESFELEAQAGDWVKVSSSIKARIGAAASDTPALVTEAEFTARNITVKIADTTANLAAASAVKASSIKLNTERAATAFLPLGDNNAVPAVEFDSGAFEAKGELVVRLTDTQYETDFLANTRKAMSVTLVNGNESLAFTASKVRYRELEKSKDKDGIVTATIQYFCEFDTTANSSIVPVLSNGVSTYTAA